MGHRFLGLLLQDPQQPPLFPQAAALLLVILKIVPGHLHRLIAQLAELIAQLGNAGLIFREIERGQIAPETALHQLLGLGQLIALQQVQHHAVAGGELAHQRIRRCGGQLAGFAHPFKAALHRDHIALGVESAAAGAAGHLQKLTAHQRPMAPLGAFRQR